MNLKNMKNFEELSFEEMRSVEGGLGFWETVGAGLIVATFVAIVDDWDNFKAGLQGKPEIKR